MELVIGRIGRAHGIRGELSVDLRTDDPEARFAVGTVVATDPASAGPLTITATRPHSGRLLVQFEQVADRTAAEGLRGVLLLADIDPDDDAEDDGYYPHQLVGLRVVTDAGDEVGEVRDVQSAPAHDLLVVRRDDGGEALVPFVTALVPDVDLTSGRLVVADRPGLLRPDEADAAEG
ncbi:MAG: ribosome maturation factor RimM [Propionibacteriales bacterium]|nr:ribosome maturation factor RimM [Propionibacteriales bacterium]